MIILRVEASLWLCLAKDRVTIFNLAQVRVSHIIIHSVGEIMDQGLNCSPPISIYQLCRLHRSLRGSYSRGSDLRKIGLTLVFLTSLLKQKMHGSTTLMP